MGVQTRLLSDMLPLPGALQCWPDMLLLLFVHCSQKEGCGVGHKLEPVS